jgi:hypothetical protein
MPPIDRLVKMYSSMTPMAERDQVVGGVIAERASQVPVMGLEPVHRSAVLTSPSIPLKNLLAEKFVGIRIETNTRSFGPDICHDAFRNVSVNFNFCGSGNSEYSRSNASSAPSDCSASSIAPARKSAQIISRQ